MRGDFMTPEPTNTNRTHKVLWIVAGALCFSLVGTIGLLFWLGVKPGRSARVATSSATHAPAPASRNTAACFAELADEDVAGRYKITDGDKVMYIVLNEDHTFINQDGTTYAPYNW